MALSHAQKERLRDFAIGVSLANLIFFAVWSEIIAFTERARYYAKTPPGAVDLFAAMADVLLLGFVFFLSIRVARGTKNKYVFAIAEIGLFLVIAIPLNELRKRLPPEFGAGMVHQPAIAVPVGIVGLVGAGAIWKFHRKVVRITSHVLLILTPFAVWMFARAVYVSVMPETRLEAPSVVALTPRGNSRPPQRVVWVIFDELEQRLGFEERPSGLVMPAFDRLASESFVAVNALPPAGHTLESIPALLSGRLVEKSEVIDATLLDMTLEGGEKATWSTLETIFSSTRERGARIGVVGWYHPYCRIFGETLDSCRWEPIWQLNIGQHETPKFFESMFMELHTLLPTHSRHLHRTNYEKEMEAARALVADASIDFAFVHLPVPHSPGIYDREKGAISETRLSPVIGYFDNLALADRALAELRTSMEANGTWDKTIVVVSADHPWRESKTYDGKTDSRVPFFVKIGAPARYEEPFNTVLSRELIESMLDGKVKDTADLTAWLDAHKTITKSPYDFWNKS